MADKRPPHPLPGKTNLQASEYNDEVAPYPPTGEEGEIDPGALAAQGRRLLDSQDFDKAARLYQRLTRLTPGDADAHHMLALSLIQGGKAPLALGPLSRAVELAPAVPLYRFNLGKLHFVCRDWVRAEEHLVRALQMAPPSERRGILEIINQARARRGLPPRDQKDCLAQAPARELGPYGYPDPPGLEEGSVVSPDHPDRRMLMCCVTGSDNFVDQLIAGLAPDIQVEKLVSSLSDHFLAAIARHQTIWLEWGLDMAASLTNQARALLAGKRVILRIHGYEILSGEAEKIDYRAVSDLVLVGRHMRQYLLAAKPEIARQVPRIHVIPNGVDTGRFRLGGRRPGHNLAYVGWLNHKKGPMVLMHAFYHLHRREPRFHLHIAGEFNQSHYRPALQGFLEENGLAGSVTFHGWVEDMPAWLADKHYLISTSLSESQGLGIMEAMATGMMPLIYGFPGAESVYPRDLLWRNFDELGELVRKRIPPAVLRGFVEENYSLEQQVEKTRRMLLEEETIDFPGYRWQAA